MRYELKRTSDSQFMFNLKAGNNEVILTSERYRTKASAEAGIESVRTNSAIADRFERRTAADKKPYFVLKAGNGEIIGHSEQYNSTAAMENGIKSVQTNGPIGKVVDNTAEIPQPRSKPVPAPPASAAALRADTPVPQPTPQPPLLPPQQQQPPRPML